MRGLQNARKGYRKFQNKGTKLIKVTITYHNHVKLTEKKYRQIKLAEYCILQGIQS
jgi:hypothetical protein